MVSLFAMDTRSLSDALRHASDHRNNEAAVLVRFLLVVVALYPCPHLMLIFILTRWFCVGPHNNRYKRTALLRTLPVGIGNQRQERRRAHAVVACTGRNQCRLRRRSRRRTDAPDAGHYQS